MFGTSTVMTSDSVRQVREHAQGGNRGQLNVLAEAFTPLQTQIVLTHPISGIQVGQSVEIEWVSYLVTQVDTATRSLGVVSEVPGTAGTHAVGARVFMRPRYTTRRIITELNNDLAELSAQGLVKISAHEADAEGVVVLPDNIIKILDVWSREPGDVDSRQLPETAYRIVDGPTGVELRGPKGLDFIVAGTTLTPLPTDTDVNIASWTGLQATAVDIPPYGAAMSLLAGTESQRNIINAQGETRRAEEVPPGAVSGAVALLGALRQERIVSEVQRLQRRYGFTRHVGAF